MNVKKTQRLSICAAVLALALTGCTDPQEQARQEQLTRGEAIVKTTCKVCHAQGLNGAPIIGNKKMWSKRIGQGIPTLVDHASSGYGLMPAKGGYTDLTTADIEDAVTFMVDKVSQP